MDFNQFKRKYKISTLGKSMKYVLLAGNIFIVILLFLSTKAPTTEPSQYLFIAYLGMGFPILLFFNAVYLVIWIVTFNWKLIIFQLLALAVCINSILIYFPVNKSVEQVDPKYDITVMTYNVRGFNWLEGDDARKNPILNYIANSKADIICLQEFALEEKKNKDKILSIDEFDDIMKDYPYRAIVRLGNTESSCIYGLVCYSKYPILRQGRVPIESAYNGSAMYEIQIGAKTITVVNNHLESNHITEEDKALYKELVKNKNSELVNPVSQSIQSKLTPAFKTRERQANIISNCIKEQLKNTNSLILCGDFNEPPISYAYNKIRGTMVDSFAAVGCGPGITYHQDGFLFRIDYIMHTQSIQSKKCYVDKVDYSDHYPVFSYLSIQYA